jgi:arylsulfatase A-like enzyme
MKKLILLFLLALTPLGRAEDRRPNFVLILAHDLGRDRIGCYGAKQRTPNIDQLAAMGIRYETAWSMLDGDLSHQALVHGRYPSRLAPEQPTFAKLLIQSGYQREDHDFDHDLKLPDKRPYLLLCQVPRHQQTKRVDELVGQLARATADENTFLLFTSAAGKSATTDVGAHVPFIVRAPFLGRGGRVSKDLVDFTDLFPTLLDLAGIRQSAGLKLDGVSLVPSLRGSDDPFEKRNWIVSEKAGFRMARDWHHFVDTNGQFHDLEKDPQQKQVVSVLDKQAPHRRKRLQMILDRFPRQ